MALPDGAASVFSVATRVSTLDQNGFVAVGALTYTTNQLLKLTFAPTMETGDDLVTKNAAGDIVVRYKHGDMLKYYTVTIDLATPDPTLESLMCGGVIFADSSIALTPPASAPTATPSSTGGTLQAGSYYYRITAYNLYGETLPSPESTVATVTGTTGSVALTWATVANAYGYRIYGRAQGAEQLIATVPGQAVTSYTDTGAITPLGALPAANTTAGPGSGVGVQSPALGIVGNPNGVSIECWAMAVVNGVRATYLPYYRWAFPMVKNMRPDSRDITNAVATNSFVGEGFENPNWGSGPFGDWPFDSTKVWQRARVGAASIPATGFAPLPATV